MLLIILHCVNFTILDCRFSYDLTKMMKPKYLQSGKNIMKTDHL